MLKKAAPNGTQYSLFIWIFLLTYVIEIDKLVFILEEKYMHIYKKKNFGKLHIYKILCMGECHWRAHVHEFFIYAYIEYISILPPLDSKSGSATNGLSSGPASECEAYLLSNVGVNHICIIIYILKLSNAHKTTTEVSPKLLDLPILLLLMYQVWTFAHPTITLKTWSWKPESSRRRASICLEAKGKLMVRIFGSHPRVQVPATEFTFFFPSKPKSQFTIGRS